MVSLPVHTAYFMLLFSLYTFRMLKLEIVEGADEHIRARIRETNIHLPLSLLLFSFGGL